MSKTATRPAVRALPVSRGRQGFLPLAGGPDDAGPFPWERPWWLPTRGGWPTLGYLVLIHVTAVVGLIVAPWPGWQVLVATLVMAWLGGMGTTICYHRAIAHRSVRLNPIVRNILTFFAMLNGSGAPLSWAAYHRHHHATSDTSRDISSPRLGGFWWSHLRWLWQGGPAPQEHYCRDLDSFSYRFWGKVQIPVLALSYFGPLVFGWPAFFWMGSIRLVYSLHGQCFVNSVCHLGPLCEEKDSSKNVWWLSLAHLFQGENWHGNHHERPGSARFGWKPWQIDFGWWTILLLERLRLAKNIRVQIPSKG